MEDSVACVIEAAQQHAGQPWLFTASFDGVLTEYQDDPDTAQVNPQRLAQLRRLAEFPRVTLAVVSGRPVADVRSRLPLGNNVFYVGLHGLEIQGPDFSWVCDAASTVGDELREVGRRAQAVISEVPGARLESKGPILALHTRAVAGEDVIWCRFQLLSAAAHLVNSNAVRAIRGHHALELLPNVGCTRGEALRMIRKRVQGEQHEPVFTIYLAEDLAEDTAIVAAREDGVAAVAGRRGRADAHLTSITEVDALIAELLQCLGEAPPRK